MNEFHLDLTPLGIELNTMKWRKLMLFLAGLFFGGAIDHIILALMRSSATPYGMHVGVHGNWLLAVLDLLLTGLLYGAHRFLDMAAAKSENKV